MSFIIYLFTVNRHDIDDEIIYLLKRRPKFPNLAQVPNLAQIPKFGPSSQIWPKFQN